MHRPKAEPGSCRRSHEISFVASVLVPHQAVKHRINNIYICRRPDQHLSIPAICGVSGILDYWLKRWILTAVARKILAYGPEEWTLWTKLWKIVDVLTTVSPHSARIWWESFSKTQRLVTRGWITGLNRSKIHTRTICKFTNWMTRALRNRVTINRYGQRT